MTATGETTNPKLDLRRLPRNLWAVSLTSMFTDISSEMIFHLLPLYLSNVLGARTSVIGLIEGVREQPLRLTHPLRVGFRPHAQAQTADCSRLQLLGRGQAALPVGCHLANGPCAALCGPPGKGHSHRAARRAGRRQHRPRAARNGFRLAPRGRHAGRVARPGGRRLRGVPHRGRRHAAGDRDLSLGGRAEHPSGGPRRAQPDPPRARSRPIASAHRRHGRRATRAPPSLQPALLGFHRHGRPVHSRQLIGCLPRAARAGTRPDRAAGHAHARHVQPGLHPGPPCRLACAPTRSAGHA